MCLISSDWGWGGAKEKERRGRKGQIFGQDDASKGGGEERGTNVEGLPVDLRFESEESRRESERQSESRERIRRGRKKKDASNSPLNDRDVPRRIVSLSHEKQRELSDNSASLAPQALGSDSEGFLLPKKGKEVSFCVATGEAEADPP